MQYRVDELAARCGVSVDTVRYYQAKGLLDRPSRRGRVAWYSDSHADRVTRVRALQRKGLTLAAIRRVLGGPESDRDLAAAVAAAGGSGDESFSREELATRTGVPAALIVALERDGILVANPLDPGRYTAEDVEAARSAMRLLESGIPLGDLLSLAAGHHAATAATVEHAVDLFDAHVRQPLLASGIGPEEASRRLVEAFESLLPAATALVAHHFRRLVLATATARLAAS